ncbi:MAG TPA: cache domain-containing protein [Paenarthrobacter sp.]|nr:cache domain-containing protein [Paenarthrobacter sp.]
MSEPLNEAAQEAADVLARSLDAVFESLQVLREAAGPLLNSPKVTSLDLMLLEPTVRELIDRHRGLVDGAGLAVAPGLLGDAETWMQSWHTHGGQPSFTRHNLNPASVNYYDYTHTSWYQRPVASGQAVLTGPYWDFGGTDTTIITASLPVPGPENKVSVVAADLSVHHLEVTFLRALGKQDLPVALVSESGKVVASNSARYAVGRTAAADVSARSVALPMKSLTDPWQVVFPR